MKSNPANVTVDDNTINDISHVIPPRFVYPSLCLALVILLLAVAPAQASVESESIITLRYGLTSQPQEQGEESSRYWQLENSVNLELARRAGLTPVKVECPFRRCHKDLASGRIDVMSLVRPSKSRAENAYFLSAWEMPDAYLHFYVRRGEEARLSTLHDLFDLRLGLLHGASYSSFIDSDERLHRTYAVKPILLPKMLMVGRIDTFITAHIPEYVLREQFPDVVTAPVKHPVPPFALAALGRHNERAKALRVMLTDVVKTMIEERTVEQLFEKYGYPAPELIVPVGIDWHLSQEIPDSRSTPPTAESQ